MQNATQKSTNNTPLSKGKRLAYARKLSGLSVAELADMADIGFSTIKYWEAGYGKGLTEKGALKIIDALAKASIIGSVNWLLTGVGNEPQKNVSTHKDLLSATPEVSDDSCDEIIDYEISTFTRLNPGAICASINDDGMCPLYSPGDRVGGIIVSLDDIDKVKNKNCIVVTKEHGLLVRCVIVSTGNKNFNLFCVNESSSEERLLIDATITDIAPITRYWTK